MAERKSNMDYFNEGQEAYRENKPQSDNPYQHNPYVVEQASLWNQGWESEHKAGYGN